MNRPLRVLLLHPGASWSTADVFDGLLFGLRQHGAVVTSYRLDTRIDISGAWLHSLYERKILDDPTLTPPTTVDVVYHAGIGALEMALREQSDVVLVVSASLLHPDVIALMKRAGLTVVVLFTETPYDFLYELRVAKMVDGCWTHERTAVDAFKAVTPRCGYLPHAWHPVKHYAARHVSADVAAHDVVFVGSGFDERIKWFNAIDWTGIDLGLYGSWDAALGLRPELQASVRNTPITNVTAAALYRRAKIGLNLYRDTPGYAPESLSPRVYELAACGCFTVSQHRAETVELFGGLMPTFQTPQEAEHLMRLWLADDVGRRIMAAQLPARVADHSWVHRAQTILGDLYSLVTHNKEQRDGSISRQKRRDLSVDHWHGRRNDRDQVVEVDAEQGNG